MAQNEFTKEAAQSTTFVAYDNNDPPQLWLWIGDPGDETAEPWIRLRHTDNVQFAKTN